MKYLLTAASAALLFAAVAGDHGRHDFRLLLATSVACGVLAITMFVFPSMWRD